MSDTPKISNEKAAETDVVAAANHHEGRHHIFGRSGRDYGILRPGELAWVSPVDLDDAWRAVPAADEPKKSAKAKAD